MPIGVTPGASQWLSLYCFRGAVAPGRDILQLNDFALVQRQPINAAYSALAQYTEDVCLPACLSVCWGAQVEGAGLRSLQLSVPQLQKNFKKTQVVATVQCTGNRRAEMKAVPAPGGGGHQIKGLDWRAGAIGTAEWGGVLLRDVLLAAGRCKAVQQPGLPSVFSQRSCFVQLLLSLRVWALGALFAACALLLVAGACFSLA